MKKLALPLFTFVCLTTTAFAKENTGEILFKYKDNLNKMNTKSLQIIGINSKSVINNGIVNIFRPTQKTNNIETIMKAMNRTGLFKFVEANTIESEIKHIPGDPDFDKQWQHKSIDTQNAWQITKGNSDVVVAVCDSGVEDGHEDLKEILIEGWDFIGRDSDPNPATSHGTFVTGLIAANVGNNLGVAGIAPNIKILPLRIANSKGSTSMSTITKCIRYAADKGARVINVSFTGVNMNSVEAAGKYARSKGALLVYSAGNQGQNNRNWKDKKHVLAVGATNFEDKLWKYDGGGSNIGPYIDLVGPGQNVYSTTTYIRHNPNSAKYRTGSGTSYSAPIVSAVAALIFSANPSLSPAQVENILKTTSDKVGAEYSFGSGRVNAFEAVKKANSL